jgi:hypothetical protein
VLDHLTELPLCRGHRVGRGVQMRIGSQPGSHGAPLQRRNKGLLFDRVTRLPTVRQPNTVAVDSATGRLFVTGTDEGVLQIIDP